MFNKFHLLFLFLPFVWFCISCDENDETNELSNTMWVFPINNPSEVVYYEFTKDKLYYFEYSNYPWGDCIPLNYQANFTIKDKSIWIKKYTEWKKLSDYELKNDTLFLKDIISISHPFPWLPLVPFHKNDSTWVVCD